MKRFSVTDLSFAGRPSGFPSLPLGRLEDELVALLPLVEGQPGVAGEQRRVPRRHVGHFHLLQEPAVLPICPVMLRAATNKPLFYPHMTASRIGQHMTQVNSACLRIRHQPIYCLPSKDQAEIFKLKFCEVYVSNTGECVQSWTIDAKSQ